MALRACTMKVSQPAAATVETNRCSSSSLSLSSMPMRCLTVTGTLTSRRMAATPSATTSGVAIRQAPNEPFCTRSLGQPTLRLISS